MRSVTVRVPATSANMGPGFDSLGCALSLYNLVRFKRTDGGITVTGCDEQYANADNLAVVSFFRTLRQANGSMPGLAVDINARIPISRGLGSSAALIVAGAVAANAFCENALSNQELLNICTEIEGHPDNVTPALYGGLTASMMYEGKPVPVRLGLSDLILFTALIPPFYVSTHDARAVLPKEIPFADAVFGVTRLVPLIKGLETGDGTLISQAMGDALHEPYRQTLIRGYDVAKKVAKGCGAAAFYISGSGSTCMCITINEDISPAIRARLEESWLDWDVLPLKPDMGGASVLEVL